MSAEKLEGQLKMVEEELEIVQRSYEELASKKSSELELLTKEINSTVLKERDSKQRVLVMERELSDTRDIYRTTYQELDARTKENDHLVSLLEDQE